MMGLRHQCDDEPKDRERESEKKPMAEIKKIFINQKLNCRMNNTKRKKERNKRKNKVGSSRSENQSSSPNGVY